MMARIALTAALAALRAGALMTGPALTAEDWSWILEAEQEMSTCSDEEKAISGPMFELADIIVGKVAGKSVTPPMAPPTECARLPSPLEMKKPMAALTRCYHAWGFTEPVAACWAMERIDRWKKCPYPCGVQGYEFTARDSVECHKCFGKLRLERQSCALTAVGITEPCQDCSLKAHRFWNTECLVMCKDSFALGPTPKCSQCSDRYKEMLAPCMISNATEATKPTGGAGKTMPTREKTASIRAHAEVSDLQKKSAASQIDPDGLSEAAALASAVDEVKAAEVAIQTNDASAASQISALASGIDEIDASVDEAEVAPSEIAPEVSVQTASIDAASAASQMAALAVGIDEIDASIDEAGVAPSETAPEVAVQSASIDASSAASQMAALAAGIDEIDASIDEAGVAPSETAPEVSVQSASIDAASAASQMAALAAGIDEIDAAELAQSEAAPEVSVQTSSIDAASAASQMAALAAGIDEIDAAELAQSEAAPEVSAQTAASSSSDLDAASAASQMAALAAGMDEIDASIPSEAEAAPSEGGEDLPTLTDEAAAEIDADAGEAPPSGDAGLPLQMKAVPSEYDVAGAAPSGASMGFDFDMSSLR